jgi:beta-galactosidase
MTPRRGWARGSAIAYGGDYNPEQWPEDLWLADARLMREAGVNLATVAVFAWARLEPRPGEYSFDWLDRVLDLLYDHGVSTDLATATASPPPWLAAHHPESLPVTLDGVRLWPGGRQQYCPHSVAYRTAALALVERLARRYASHPGLALWHINNEYGGMRACYCDVSAASFRGWLRRRYGDLDALNRAWGTSFWSQQYGDWEEIGPPRRVPAVPNPSQELDFRRFTSDSFLDLFRAERAVLKKTTPEVPVTTNFMGFFKPLDYWGFAAEEDIVSNDIYPDPADPEAALRAAMTHDLVRSLAGGGPWYLMEQTASRVNWRRRNVAKGPGQQRLWSYQALARGADGILFFQWRASVFGAEKFHGAMLPHAGERARSWQETVKVGTELGALGEVVGSRIVPSVAIVFGWDNWWALELPGKPAEIQLLDQVLSYYRPLWKSGLTAEFARPGADLSGRALVLVPNLYLVDEPAAAEIDRYVCAGGVAVISFFSGIVDANDHVRGGPYPVPWTEMLGAEVLDFYPYPEAERGSVRTWTGEEFGCDLWAETVVGRGAQVVATYETGPLAGEPAVLRHQHGKGEVFYVGTRLDHAGMAWLVDMATTGAVIILPGPLPPGVEAVRRVAKGTSFLFLLNHSAETVDVKLEAPGLELLSGQKTDAVQLLPRDVAVVREESAP